MDMYTLFRQISVTVVIILGLSACREQTADLSIPPEEDQFLWGQPVSETISNLKSLGFFIYEEDPQVVELIPVDHPEEIHQDFDFPGLSSSPYTISLFSYEGGLVAARIIRRDTSAVLADYNQVLLDLYGLSEPAYESSREIPSLETENIFIETDKFYETDDLIVRTSSIETRSPDPDVQEMLYDELEIQLFSKEHNPGITIEALAMPEEVTEIEISE